MVYNLASDSVTLPVARWKLLREVAGGEGTPYAELVQVYISLMVLAGNQGECSEAILSVMTGLPEDKVCGALAALVDAELVAAAEDGHLRLTTPRSYHETTGLNTLVRVPTRPPAHTGIVYSVEVLEGLERTWAGIAGRQPDQNQLRELLEKTKLTPDQMKLCLLYLQRAVLPMPAFRTLYAPNTFGNCAWALIQIADDWDKHGRPAVQNTVPILRYFQTLWVSKFGQPLRDAGRLLLHGLFHLRPDSMLSPVELDRLGAHMVKLFARSPDKVANPRWVVTNWASIVKDSGVVRGQGPCVEQVQLTLRDFFCPNSLSPAQARRHLEFLATAMPLPEDAWSVLQEAVVVCSDRQKTEMISSFLAQHRGQAC